MFFRARAPRSPAALTLRARWRGPAALLALLVASFGSVPVHAYEVDNFTGRDRIESDSLATLDAKVNRILERAVEAANRESRRAWCSRAMLHQQFLRWVGPDPISFLELWATFSNEVQQFRIGIDESVYRGATPKDGPMLWVAGVARSLKVNGHIIGTDKLGHFFMQGYDYFRRVQGGESIERILRVGHREDGLWGLGTSGVYSYADKATNYEGFRFWSRLYGREKPYVVCENEKQWRKVGRFTFADYVSDAWDEAINCSEMRPSLASKFERNLAVLGLACPVSLEKCAALAHLPQARYRVSPRCLGEAPMLPEVLSNPAAPALPPQKIRPRR